MSDQRMRLFFEPGSVAIVGASADPAKASGLPLRNLLNSKFSGPIYAVNPRAAEINGVRCYPSIMDVPEPPDVALLMVDARITPEVLEECGRKGVKAVVIGSAGFSEAGDEGRERQARLNDIAKKYALRVCGPNCHGTLNVRKGIPIGYDHSFALPLAPGPVAIASHSGALLGVLGHRAVQAGLGLSYLVSNGNEMDLDLCDFMEFFLEDVHTSVVAVLMEVLKNGPRFLELAGRAHEAGKKIVVLKVGKSERGAIATMAHTARMAGSSEIYEAAFRQFGVVSTDTVETFLGAAQLAAHQSAPREGRLLIMTSSGAGASLMADKATEYGIALADISDEAKNRIPERRSAILTNPFDTAGASRAPGFLTSVCEAFAADSANDCLLLYLGPLAVRHEYAKCFAAAAQTFGKTATAIINLPEQHIRDIFQQHQIPVFEAATDACFKMLRAYIDYGQWTAKRAVSADRKTSCAADVSAAEKILTQNRGATILPPAAASELLRQYGLECAASVQASTSDDALRAAAAMGFPVILKGITHDIAHKNEFGLVSHKVSNTDEVKREFDALQANAAKIGKKAVQVSIEKYIPHDLEIIVGVKYDPTFGPAILCGFGGIFTEILNDFSLKVAPLTRQDAVDMLLSLKAYPVLARITAADGSPIELLTDAILRVSDLATDLDGRISAVDINPLVLRPDLTGTVVLDAKIHVSKPEEL